MSSTRQAIGAAMLAAGTLAALTGAAPPPESAEERLAATLTRIFPGNPQFALRSVTLSDNERRAIASAGGDPPPGDTVLVRTASQNGRVVGFALVNDVPGRDRPITLMVATDTVPRVRSVEILAYREAYGGEVRQASWREQFVGKSSGDPVRWGRDIRNISGATISARSVTRGVKSALATLQVVAERCAHP